LANCGFVYTGQSDHVVCQRCGVEFSGWLGTDRSPIVEHRCPGPPSSVVDRLPPILRDAHRDWTIFAVYAAARRRATKNGVLPPLAESRDPESSRDRLGHASPDPDARQMATPADDDVAAGDRVTSGDSGDENVRTLRLSLSRRRASTCHHCPWCACCWW